MMRFLRDRWNSCCVRSPCGSPPRTLWRTGVPFQLTRDGRSSPKRYAHRLLGNFPEPRLAELEIAAKRECSCSFPDRGSSCMRLMLQLIARLLVVVGLCLSAAILWATIDAYRSVDRATAASAQRVSQALQAIY